MRYIVLGAGALGGSIGARLALGGCDVALVARGEHLAALQSAGLRLREPEHDRTVATPAFASVGEVQPPIGSADVVILAVKVQGAAAALAELAALTAGDSPAVVCCTNGIDAERQALRHFERTYAMLPCMFATHLEPGHCEMFGHSSDEHQPAWLSVGVYPSGTDALSDAMAADLEACGFRADSDADVMTKKRGKMLMNLGNATAAVSGSSTDAGRALMSAATKEAIAAYTAAGLSFSDQRELASTWFEIIGGPPNSIAIEGAGEYMGSSWQSLARSAGDIECAFLNGEVCLLGRLHGVDTPANHALQVAAEGAARAGAEAESFVSAEELLRTARL